MPIVNVGTVEVVLATVISCILGMIWYAPQVFGNTWAKLAGVKMDMKDKSKGMKSMAGMLIASLVTAYVFAHIMGFAQVANVTDALLTAFWVWLGFVATIGLNMVFFEGKPVKLYLINVGYQLVSLILMSLVILYV